MCLQWTLKDSIVISIVVLSIKTVDASTEGAIFGQDHYHPLLCVILLREDGKG